jgi:hypothetical protein
MPELLSKTKCIVYNPTEDGNCLFRALQRSYYGTETLHDCYWLRNKITQYMIRNPTFMLCPNYFPYSIAEWTSMNTDLQHDDNHLLACYCDRMKDATPHLCEYGTVIEAFTFSIIEQVNIIIYQALIDQTALSYQKRAENIVIVTTDQRSVFLIPEIITSLCFQCMTQTPLFSMLTIILTNLKSKN